jgi:hypothetical protein
MMCAFRSGQIFGNCEVMSVTFLSATSLINLTNHQCDKGGLKLEKTAVSYSKKSKIILQS